MKNVLLFIFAVGCVGFFFFVVTTQIIQPMMFPGRDVPLFLDVSLVLNSYIEKVLSLVESK